LITFAIRHGINIDTRKHKKEIAEAFHAAMTLLKERAYHIAGDDNMSTMYANDGDPDIKAAIDILNDNEKWQQILNEKPSTIQ
jgi:hypothetical protein